MTREEIQQLINVQYGIINDRETKLAAYDYIGVKIAMGVSTKEEYAEKIAETEQWRSDINVAQEEIERLEAIEPDEPPMPAFEDGV